MYKKFLAGLILILSTASQVAAAEEYFPRFSVEGGLGVNLILPFAQLRAGYRLPFADNRFDLNFSHSYNVAIGIPLQISTIGARYYFADNSADPGLFKLQPFFTASAGVSYHLPGDYGYYNNPDISFQSPVFAAGIGTDLQIIKNVQLSGTANIFLPFILRPEINLKVRF